MSTATLERVSAPAEWAPSYSKWRHGGWYVHNVGYPSGAAGCVSKDFPDGKWRIVCHPLPFDRQPTFKSRDEAARAEYLLARSPEVIAEWEGREARRIAKEAEREALRAATEAHKAAQQRELVQLVARDVREAAQCGTANSEAIAAWILENFVERAVHDDVIAEHRETLAEIADERKDENAEIIDELNCAIDIAKRAADAVGTIDHALDSLNTSALEFAYGATPIDKVLDVLSDGIRAIDTYQWNPNNSDLPERRESK